MLKLYKNIERIIKNIADDRLTLFSAQASYYIIISAFPFIMLLISLAGFILPIDRHSFSITINAFVPKTIQQIVSLLTEELFEKSIPILSVTALTTLWSSSRGIASIERGVLKVYSIPENKNFIFSSLLSIVYTVMFIAILLATLFIGVFGNAILEIINEHITFSVTEIFFIKSILLFALICSIFHLMYYFFARRQIPFRKHIPGAVFSSLGWLVFSKLFSVYIDNFANYSYIYGSLTAVVLLMLWLYFCVMILLCGAELNMFLINLKTKD